MRSAGFARRLVLAVSLAHGAGALLATAEEPQARQAAQPEESTVLDFTVQNIDGAAVHLADYRGDVLLIVNVASECGLTPTNYDRMGPLYEKYENQGFRILAFPANDFGRQEPGTNEQIKQFCTNRYGVRYDLFAKVSVKGEDICPLYKFLTEHPDEDIRGEVAWNFQKYLVGRDGKVLAKFHPRTAPDDPKLVAALEAALKAPRPAKEKPRDAASAAAGSG